MNEQLPKHLAVIMDGNGRWAKQRGLARAQGHRAGAEAVRVLLQECHKLEIPYVTVFAFSKENWRRPISEVEYLLDLFADFMQIEAAKMQEKGIRMEMIGDRGDLPERILNILDCAVQQTSSGDKMLFTLALSYSGRAELVEAARRLLVAGLSPADVDEITLRKYFYSPDLPDPDLLIRTSGELRLSNFMLFQCAYTELYFCDKFWPDFDPAALHDALQSYASRQRRFGLV